jgi:hypothetical protein
MVREALTSEDKATNFNEANNKLNLTQTSSSIGKTLLNTRNNTNSLLSCRILSQSDLLSSAKLSLPKATKRTRNVIETNTKCGFSRFPSEGATNLMENLEKAQKLSK